MKALKRGKLDVRVYVKGTVSVIKRASQRGSGISIQSHLSLGGVRLENLRPYLAPTLGGLRFAPEDTDETLFGFEPDLGDSPAYSVQRPRHSDEFPPDRLFGLFARLDTSVFAHDIVFALYGLRLQAPAIVVRRGCSLETLRGLAERKAVPRYLEGGTGRDEVNELHLPFASRAEPP